jgi:hypothetical protein
MVGVDIAIGVGAGLAATFLAYFTGKPRVVLLKFGQHEARFGRLYDAEFRLTPWGWMDPGTCTLTIEWRGGSTFAKWDETPNPLNRDRLDSFRPELVPATFCAPIHARATFTVPILIEPAGNTGQREIFSAWWFGKDQGYGPPPAVDDGEQVTLTLRGSAGLRWRATYTVAEIVGGGRAGSWWWGYPSR